MGFGSREGHVRPSRVWETRGVAQRKYVIYDVQILYSLTAIKNSVLPISIFWGYPNISHQFCTNPMGAVEASGGFNPRKFPHGLAS